MVWVLLFSKMGQFPKGLVGLGVFTVISSLFLTVFCLFVCFFSLFFFGKKAGLPSTCSKHMQRQGGCICVTEGQ